MNYSQTYTTVARPISPLDELSPCNCLLFLSHYTVHFHSLTHTYTRVCVRVCVCGDLFNALQVGSCSRSGQIRAAHSFLLGGEKDGEKNIASTQEPLHSKNGATSTQTWIHSAPSG